MPIKEWSPETAAAEAKKNAIIVLYGTSKTGKTELATSTGLPLYYIHLDPNDNLNEHLLARHKKYPNAWTAEPLWIPPIPYKMLTRELAQEYVEKIEQYCADARARATNLNEPGLLVIDGGKRLKGYVEKWKLGDSATLGYRAAPGERGVSQIQYSESNAYFNDIINAFVGSPLHLIVTFEAREKWAVGEGGRRTPTGKYEPKMSGGREGEISYTLNALIETLVEAVKGPVVDNKQTWLYEHKLRFDLLGFVDMAYLRNRTMPAMSFDTLLDLLHSNIPAESVLDAPHEINRVDMAEPEAEEE